jgi:predicted AAA+ superfamily ATPase
LLEVDPELRFASLIQLINHGGLPAIYDSDDVEKDLESYINLYLIEEIRNEALTRHFDAFERFFEVMGHQNGKELHYTNISSDSGVPIRTIENYIQVLKDTLIGVEITPFEKTRSRKAITRSKFFLFDLGVARRLSATGAIRPKSEAFGHAFEHFILLELRARLHYLGRESLIQYWRTKNGFEVDFVVNQKTAIEVKAIEQITERHLRGLLALKEEKLLKRYIVVSLDPVKRTINGIELIPWTEFIQDSVFNEL